MNPASQGVVFLIQTIFEFYLLLLILTVLLRLGGAQFMNPIVQFLVKMTNPVLKPARKCLPSKGSVDWGAWLAIFLIKFIEVVLLMLFTSLSPSIIGMVLYSIFGVCKLTLNVYFFAIIVFAIMSWFQGVSHHPLNHVLYYLTEPVLKPVRGLIPLVGGVDLSPLIVIVVLQLINIILLNPLINMSLGMMQ